jgi:hypothetical protein
LEEWGLDIPNFDGVSLSDEFSEDFSLPDGDKAPFQQMTFTLADEQAEQIKNAIADIKKTEEYKYCETMGNEKLKMVMHFYFNRNAMGQSKGNNC